MPFPRTTKGAHSTRQTHDTESEATRGGSREGNGAGSCDEGNAGLSQRTESQAEAGGAGAAAALSTRTAPWAVRYFQRQK